MDTQTPLTLLGGLSARQFMQRYWQKKPLLVRNAMPGFQPMLSRSALMQMAERDAVESRLIVHGPKGWKLSHGPMRRRSLPPLTQPRWTLLVQGVDLHDDRVHGLMQQFRFVPDARLDDVMISYATDGGGVGPHFDSYDVFLIQAHGQRRWRYGRQKNLSLEPNVPLKILTNFVPEFDEVLDPGDMLYLPPRYAHDGVAVGECMTYSVGFRVPQVHGLGQELVRNALDAQDDEPAVPVLYRDPGQAAVEAPAQLPESLRAFARAAVQKRLHALERDTTLLDQMLGETLTEPKPRTWFEPSEPMPVGDAVRVLLDRRSRMLYDDRHVFINGESYRAAGADARLMRELADQRQLAAGRLAGASGAARALLLDWSEAGWVHLVD